MEMRKLSAGLLILSLVLFTPVLTAARTAKDVWSELEKMWNKVEDVRSVIQVFVYYPESLRAHFPESKEEMEGNLGGWKYHGIKYTWKKPGKIHVEFIFGKNLGVDIVSKLVEKNPGTRLVFGHSDSENIYVRFPPSKTKEAVLIDKQIEKKIFFAEAGIVKYSSALLELSFSGTLMDLLRAKNRYFDPGFGTVELTKGAMKWKRNFRVKEGKALFDEEPADGQYHIITMKPLDAKKNRMIEKEIMYINTETSIPAQHEVYHKGAIVACMTVTDVKLNSGVGDELWEKFYEGAKIAAKKK